MVLSLPFAVMPDGVTTRSRAMEDQLSHHSERLDRIESALADMKQSHADSIARLQQTLSELLLRYNRPECSESTPPLLPLPTTQTPPPFLGSSLPLSIPPPPIRYENSGEPSPPIVSSAPQHQIPNLPIPSKPTVVRIPNPVSLSTTLCPSNGFPSSLFSKPFSLSNPSPDTPPLGSTTAALPSMSSCTIPALDPGDPKVISGPNPDDPVDDLDADPPPAPDPGELPELYVTSPADPFDVLDKDPPPILDHGLVFNVNERLASLDFTFTLFVSSNKKSLMMFAVENLFVHWMNRNAKEKIFDARQAQGGGRSVVFYINVLQFSAHRYASDGDRGLMRCWCSEDGLRLCLAMASRDVLPWSVMISCSPLDVFVSPGMMEFLGLHLEDKVHFEGGTNVAGFLQPGLLDGINNIIRWD